MKKENRIVNGVVYRNAKEIVFISLFDEKKKVIEDSQYFTLGEDRSPLPEDSFALVEYREMHHQVKTIPLVVVNLHIDGKKINAKQISLDGLIKAAYTAASNYIKRNASI